MRNSSERNLLDQLCSFKKPFNETVKYLRQLQVMLIIVKNTDCGHPKCKLTNQDNFVLTVLKKSIYNIKL